MFKFISQLRFRLFPKTRSTVYRFINPSYDDTRSDSEIKLKPYNRLLRKLISVTEMETKPGYVYLIHAQGSDRYKIGITTTTVATRLKQLNRQQSAYPLILVHSIQSDRPRDTEKILHLTFKSENVHGEWFRFPTSGHVQTAIREMDSLLKKNYRGVETIPPVPQSLPKPQPVVKPKTNQRLSGGLADQWLAGGKTAKRQSYQKELDALLPGLEGLSKPSQKPRPKRPQKENKPFVPYWLFGGLILIVLYIMNHPIPSPNPESSTTTPTHVVK